MCHLKPHSENPKQADVNNITKQFAEIVKAVDNFHFKKGHKGKWCQTNANPNIEMKKVGMTRANTPVCEQFFSWVNKFKNIKSMNEAHFKLFLLYILDLHNLHIEQKVDLVANPLNPRRPEAIDDKNLNIESFGKLTIDSEDKPKDTAGADSGLSDVPSFLEKDKKDTVLEDCFNKLLNGDFRCNYCTGEFKRMENLRNHLNSKHGMSFQLTCGCGKIFTDSTKLHRHHKYCAYNK